jgi:hypothetical protein
VILGATRVDATASLSVTVLFAVIMLSSATVVVAMHTILAEE